MKDSYSRVNWATAFDLGTDQVWIYSPDATEQVESGQISRCQSIGYAICVYEGCLLPEIEKRTSKKLLKSLYFYQIKINIALYKDSSDTYG